MDKNFELKEPTYCDFYKFFIVEEIALKDHPANLHYGKCSVIGYLDCINKKYHLSSISLLHAADEIKLPDKACSIVLDMSLVSMENLPLGQTVEVSGEVYSKKWNGGMVNSRYLMQQLKENRTRLEKEVKLDDLVERLDCLDTSKDQQRGRGASYWNEERLKEIVKVKFQEIVDEMKKEYTPILQVHALTPKDMAPELISMNLSLRKYMKN